MKTPIVFKICMVFPLLFFPLFVSAQTEEAEASGVLEEVTVTATRRGETDLMAMPLAMTALSMAIFPDKRGMVLSVFKGR